MDAEDRDHVIISEIKSDDNLEGLVIGNIDTTGKFQKVDPIREVYQTTIVSGKLPRHVLPLQYLIQQGMAAYALMQTVLPNQQLTAKYKLNGKRKKNTKEGELSQLVGELADSRKTPAWDIAHGRVTIETLQAKLDVTYSKNIFISYGVLAVGVNFLLMAGSQWNWMKIPSAIELSITPAFVIGTAAAPLGLALGYAAYRLRGRGEIVLTTYQETPDEVKKELVVQAKNGLGKAYR